MAANETSFDSERGTEAITARWTRERERQEERARTKQRLLDLAAAIPSELKTVKDCQMALGLVVPATIAGVFPTSRADVVIKGAATLIRALHEGEPKERDEIEAMYRMAMRQRGGRR